MISYKPHECNLPDDDKNKIKNCEELTAYARFNVSKGLKADA